MRKLPSNQEQYWNKYIKKDPCFLLETNNPFVEEMTQYSRNLCTGLEGITILEVGCGDGKDIIGMVHKYSVKRAVAIDISKERVKLAQKNVKYAGLSDIIHVMQMDANKIGFPDQYFDAIFCNSVLLFLDGECFFPEANRVLKPRGRLFFFKESLSLNPFLIVYRALSQNRNKRAAEKFAKRLTIRQIEEINNRWFTSVDHREFYLFFSILCCSWPLFIKLTSFGQIRVGLPKCKLSRAFDRMLLKSFPFLRHFAWVTVGTFTK